MPGKHYQKRFQRRRKETNKADIIDWHIRTGRTMQWIISILQKYGPTIGKYLGGLAAAGLTALVTKLGLDLSPETAAAVSAGVAALVIEAINLLYQHRDKVRQKQIQETLNKNPRSSLLIDGRASGKTQHNLDLTVKKAQLWDDYLNSQSTEEKDAVKTQAARLVQDSTYY